MMFWTFPRHCTTHNDVDPAPPNLKTLLLKDVTERMHTPIPNTLEPQPHTDHLEASKGGMKVRRIKDPLYKDSYFGIIPPTFIPPFEAPEPCDFSWHRYCAALVLLLVHAYANDPTTQASLLQNQCHHSRNHPRSRLIPRQEGRQKRF